MSSVVIGKPFATDLQSASNQTPLRDPEGALLGLFIPATLYQAAIDRWADSIINLDEIDAAIAEEGYVSTAELLKKLRG